MALQGISLPDIARQLERDGVRNRAGRRFSVSHLHRILHNRALVGRLVWNRRKHVRGRYEKPAVDWVTVPETGGPSPTGPSRPWA